MLLRRFADFIFLQIRFSYLLLTSSIHVYLLTYRDTIYFFCLWEMKKVPLLNIFHFLFFYFSLFVCDMFYLLLQFFFLEIIYSTFFKSTQNDIDKLNENRINCWARSICFSIISTSIYVVFLKLMFETELKKIAIKGGGLG